MLNPVVALYFVNEFPDTIIIAGVAIGSKSPLNTSIMPILRVGSFGNVPPPI